MLQPVANSMIVLREEFDEWAILFNPDDGAAHVLHPVSVFIWKRLDGRHSANAIAEELRLVCRDVPVDAERSIERFMQDLIDKGYAGCEVSLGG